VITGGDDDVQITMTAKGYHDRAKHFRALANQATTASLKKKLLAVADECERSALRARGREALILSFATGEAGKGDPT